MALLARSGSTGASLSRQSAPAMAPLFARQQMIVHRQDMDAGPSRLVGFNNVAISSFHIAQVMRAICQQHF
jgi:hypothetical protein